MSDSLVAQVMEVTQCAREAAVAAVEAAGPGGLELAVEIALTAQVPLSHAAAAPQPLRTKLVVLVRQDLAMGVGKVAAQVSHACLGAYKDITRSGSRNVFQAWEQSGEPTIVLAVADLVELDSLLVRAQEQGLGTHKIADAGRTEVDPGTVTVAAIGPAEVERIDAVTGGLSLL